MLVGAPITVMPAFSGWGMNLSEATLHSAPIVMVWPLIGLPGKLNFRLDTVPVQANNAASLFGRAAVV